MKLLKAIYRIVNAGYSKNELVKIKFIDAEPKGNHHPEAEYQHLKILLYPKFHKLNSEGKSWVLAHELGHWYRDEFVPLSEIMGWEPGDNFFIYDTINSDEGFAEAFAAFIFDPKDFQAKYPSQFQAMKQYVKSTTVLEVKEFIARKTKELLDK